jgi:hypothetical protein
VTLGVLTAAVLASAALGSALHDPKPASAAPAANESTLQRYSGVDRADRSLDRSAAAMSAQTSMLPSVKLASDTIKAKVAEINAAKAAGLKAAAAKQAAAKAAAAKKLAAQKAAAAKKAAAKKAAAKKAAAARAAAKRAAARRAAARRALPAGCSQWTGNQRIACAMLPSFGFSTSEMSSLNQMWNRESNWNPSAENPSSGSYGIPQALPASKMASAGPNWRTDAATQIRWGLTYIKQTYGSPNQAWAFWQAHNWY